MHGKTLLYKKKLKLKKVNIFVLSSKLNSSIYLQTRNMAISIRFKARTNDFGTMNVIHLEDELLLIPTI